MCDCDFSVIWQVNLGEAAGIYTSDAARHTREARAHLFGLGQFEAVQTAHDPQSQPAKIEKGNGPAVGRRLVLEPLGLVDLTGQEICASLPSLGSLSVTNDSALFADPSS